LLCLLFEPPKDLTSRDRWAGANACLDCTLQFPPPLEKADRFVEQLTTALIPFVLTVCVNTTGTSAKLSLNLKQAKAYRVFAPKGRGATCAHSHRAA
jgi:hypothetical protein